MLPEAKSYSTCAECACEKSSSRNYTLSNLPPCGVAVWRLSCKFTGTGEYCLMLARVYNPQCAVLYVCLWYVCVCVCVLVFVQRSSAMPVRPLGACLCGCAPACVCVPMCALRRKWLCLFKLSTLSHVGQFSGNENPAPHTPLPKKTQPSPHPSPSLRRSPLLPTTPPHPKTV